MTRDARRQRGLQARDAGRRAEWVAALWLMLHGWSIVGFRTRTPEGEIDLIIRRGTVLAGVEVKRRRSIEEALDAVKPMQQQRLLRAIGGIAARRPSWRHLDVRLDLVAIAPGRLPIHVPDVWRP